MEISVIPMGTGASVSHIVAELLKEIRAMGVKHQLTPMATIVEADLDTLLEVVRRLHQKGLDAAPRVVTVVKIDDRRDKPLSMEGKVRSVEEKLG